MKIIKVVDDEEKKKITRAILEALPEWFGIVYKCQLKNVQF